MGVEYLSIMYLIDVCQMYTNIPYTWMSHEAKDQFCWINGLFHLTYLSMGYIAAIVHVVTF